MNLGGTRNWESPSIGKQSQSGTARFRRWSTDALIGASKAACMYPPPHMTCMYPPLIGTCAGPNTTHNILATNYICSSPALAPTQHLPVSRSAFLTVFHSCFGAGFTPSRPWPTVPIHWNQFARTIFIPPVGLGQRVKGSRCRFQIACSHSCHFQLNEFECGI